MPLLRFFTFFALTVVTSSTFAMDRPNIVFIYTDDQAPTAIGLIPSSEFKTPNIDSIFREGAHLVNAFTTTPVCSPSRASLMTSRYASELNIDDWISPTREPDHGLSTNYVTWPEVLTAAGYRCGLIGKWHLGTADRFHPTNSGYDHFIGFRGGGARPKDPTIEEDGVATKRSGFTCDILTDHAIEFIHDNRARPFALSLHFRAPHAAWLPVRDEDWKPFKDLDPMIPNPNVDGLLVERIKKNTREYMAAVASVDRNVGRLLNTLDALELKTNTVVIFTSDHGYHLGHHALWYKGNAQWQLKNFPPQRWPDIPAKQRPNLFDQALRVPAAIRWPAKIKAGTVVTETLSNLDWYPTLLSLAGAEQPEVTLRGRDFTPLLQRKATAWNNDLYAEYNMKHGAKTQMRAYRTPEWKLMIDFHNEGREELYHLAKDPGETRNLTKLKDASTRKIHEQLRRRIHTKMRELRDPIASSIPN